MNINLNSTTNIQPLRPTFTSDEQRVKNAGDLKQAFNDFVGKSFYGEMLKSMRSTVGEPAYFHGGNAEKIFQQQLDHQLADDMTKSNSGDLANAMFKRQFPKEAGVLAAAEQKSAASLSDLSALRRR